jgi:hypothetical protein
VTGVTGAGAPSPFEDIGDLQITDDEQLYFGPDDPPTQFNRTRRLSIDIELSEPTELRAELSRRAKTPLSLDPVAAVPDAPGVYRIEALIWATSAGETWIERVWCYIGEGRSVSRRLQQYERASRSVKLNGRPSPRSHSQRMAYGLMRMLALEESGAAVVEQRVFLSWVLRAQVNREGRTVDLDLANVQQRRFAERALIVQSPQAANRA